MSDIPLESPCTGVCTLGDQGYCIGCLRTGEEIAAWPTMPQEQRRNLLESLAERDEMQVLSSG